MRALVIACLLALALPAHAADAPPKWLEGGKAQPGWRYIFSPTDWEAVFLLDEDIFFDEWPRVTLWSRHEYNSKAEDTAYGSALALLGYDCARDGKAEYARYAYSKPLLQGEPDAESFTADEPEWTYPEPGHGMRDFIRMVCKIARDERAQGDAVARYAQAESAAAPVSLLDVAKSEPHLSAYLVLHELFPTDWEGLQEQIRPAKSPPGTASDWSKAADFLPNFVTQREKYIPLASEKTLREVADTQRKVLQQVQSRGVPACVAYLYQSDLPEGDAEALVINGFVRAKLKAIHEGMNRPVRRNGVNDADTTALAKAFKAEGGSAEQWAAIYDGETEKLKPADRCAGWTAFYGAIATAPDGSAGRWATWFFDPSDRERTPEPEPKGITPSST